MGRMSGGTSVIVAEEVLRLVIASTRSGQQLSPVSLSLSLPLLHPVGVGRGCAGFSQGSLLSPAACCPYSLLSRVYQSNE